MKHAPTLKTILMVEETLKSMEGSVMTIAELKRKLPRQVNHNTLKAVLEYLENSNKIYMSIKGITWLENPGPKMKRLISEATRI